MKQYRENNHHQTNRTSSDRNSWRHANRSRGNIVRMTRHDDVFTEPTRPSARNVATLKQIFLTFKRW